VVAARERTGRILKGSMIRGGGCPFCGISMLLVYMLICRDTQRPRNVRGAMYTVHCALELSDVGLWC
jgi:hypothetical protein